ncbi:DUF4232 domain-containing protein [Sphingomonas sp. A2-49]|uniref:DUF4232 domain-containing protein n=1 Tax=Sphingomonas sp. A2-49 TaxID=1391375 RepID=UPI0021D3AB47|nr:DUF4232 domain-containing protein [Sphingomonas sp. A2-49]MCU6454082.1 DUF4232 domain-containing protein [Sphingomonas sp. A2-49]
MSIVGLVAVSLAVASSFVPDARAEAPLPCLAGQLSLSVNAKAGPFSGMRTSGTEVSIRNRGADCTLPALPHVAFLDARGRVLAAVRAAPVGMHPGPAMIPVRVGGGHRAATDLGWVGGSASGRDRSLRIAYVQVTIGKARLRARLAGVIDTRPGTVATFSQTPLRAMEGLAAG